MEYAAELPEATPICPAALVHLGKRRSVYQALAHLTRVRQLVRVCHGIYMRPVETCYGMRLPIIGKALENLSEHWGVVIVPSGGAAANWLGLTTQNVIRTVCLTSGRSRKLHFWLQEVELLHAPRWQLVAPHRKVGALIRALNFLGQYEIEDGLETVLPTFSDAERDELSSVSAILPIWMAKPIVARLSSG